MNKDGLGLLDLKGRTQARSHTQTYKERGEKGAGGA